MKKLINFRASAETQAQLAEIKELQKWGQTTLLTQIIDEAHKKRFPKRKKA